MAKKQRIVEKIMIDAAPEEVYGLARDPEMWSSWYAGLEGPEKLMGKGEKGTTGDFHINIAGIKFPIKIEVTEDHMSREKCRWSGTFDGRTRGNQIFEYKLKDGKTEATVQFEGTTPESLLGRVASRIVLDKMQENSIHNTMQNLKVFVEGKLAHKEEEKMT